MRRRLLRLPSKLFVYLGVDEYHDLAEFTSRYVQFSENEGAESSYIICQLCNGEHVVTRLTKLGGGRYR